MPPVPEVDSTLLIVFVEDLGSLLNPSYLHQAVVTAADDTQTRLRIVVLSPLFNPQTGLKPSHYWKEIQTFLTFLYAEATRVAQASDNVLLNVEVALRDLEPTQQLPVHDVSWSRAIVQEPS